MRLPMRRRIPDQCATKMYPPQLLDELARIFAEAALERLLVGSAGPSEHQEPRDSQCAEGPDLAIIDAASPVADLTAR